jgi:hypothetical protein
MNIDFTIIKQILFVFYLIVILCIVLFNLLYLSRALRADMSLGLKIPTWISRLTQSSVLVAVFTAILLVILLFVNFY